MTRDEFEARVLARLTQKVRRNREAQKMVCVEEIGELLAAISHRERDRAGSHEELIVELVDVECVMIQIRILYGISDDDLAAQREALAVRLLGTSSL